MQIPISAGRRKNSCRLGGPFGDPDQEAVRSFMRECLVPLLAEEFLRHRELAGAKVTVQQQTNFGTPMQEGGSTDRDSY
jgi:hypothetical protein